MRFFSTAQSDRRSLQISICGKQWSSCTNKHINRWHISLSESAFFFSFFYAFARCWQLEHYSNKKLVNKRRNKIQHLSEYCLLYCMQKTSCVPSWSWMGARRFAHSYVESCSTCTVQSVLHCRSYREYTTCIRGMSQARVSIQNVYFAPVELLSYSVFRAAKVSYESVKIKKQRQASHMWSSHNKHVKYACVLYAYAEKIYGTYMYS